MDSNKYVFVSYSRKDRSFVEKLVNDLRSSGINTWWDLAHISAGENWQKAIEKGLGEASVLLYISSRNSIQSTWMGYELRAFHEKGGMVIPVIVDDAGMMNINKNSVLSRIQWIDFRKDYNSAIEPLKRALMIAVGHGPPLKTERPEIKGYVFLSYAEEDIVFLEELREFLGNHNYAYWDYAESDRDFHIQWTLELESKICDAAATLSILSPSWKQSQWTIKEYLFSEEVDTPVFLLKAKELGPTLVIAGIPYIDFIKNRKIGFNKLAKELQRKGL